MKKGNFDAFFREKGLTENTYCPPSFRSTAPTRKIILCQTHHCFFGSTFHRKLAGGFPAVFTHVMQKRRRYHVVIVHPEGQRMTRLSFLTCPLWASLAKGRTRNPFLSSNYLSFLQLKYTPTPIIITAYKT